MTAGRHCRKLPLKETEETKEEHWRPANIKEISTDARLAAFYQLWMAFLLKNTVRIIVPKAFLHAKDVSLPNDLGESFVQHCSISQWREPSVTSHTSRKPRSDWYSLNVIDRKFVQSPSKFFFFLRASDFQMFGKRYIKMPFTNTLTVKQNSKQQNGSLNHIWSLHVDRGSVLFTVSIPFQAKHCCCCCCCCCTRFQTCLNIVRGDAWLVFCVFVPFPITVFKNEKCLDCFYTENYSYYSYYCRCCCCCLYCCFLLLFVIKSCASLKLFHVGVVLISILTINRTLHTFSLHKRLSAFQRWNGRQVRRMYVLVI